jgi:DNA (cytosine-5)-methyltransferase 1
MSHSKPRLLDLFCGAGGCSVGYARAGFEVVGVDIKPQPRYPFEFHQADALTFPLDGFDVIHASPPCQAYSVLRRANPGAEYPELVEPIRARLQESRKPYVIENVPGAPLKFSLLLCGSMFGLGSGARYLQRHRLFETSHLILAPGSCHHVGEAIGVYGGADGSIYIRKLIKKSPGPYVRRGGYQGLKTECAEAMDIDWMTRTELTQAIPPAYTEWIGRQLLDQIKPT